MKTWQKQQSGILQETETHPLYNYPMEEAAEAKGNDTDSSDSGNSTSDNNAIATTTIIISKLNRTTQTELK